MPSAWARAWTICARSIRPRRRGPLRGWRHERTDPFPPAKAAGARRRGHVADRLRPAAVLLPGQFRSASAKAAQDIRRDRRLHDRDDGGDAVLADTLQANLTDALVFRNHGARVR